eukprot:g6051.t1
MSRSYSRLLVLVEDTSATSRLWPLWQRHSIEPLLRSISEGHFGIYEFCLVAFSSTDGHSNALFQKTSWTTNPVKFSQQIKALKFEGICGGHALTDALAEAAYLSQQPSNLTALKNFTQHVLVCATSSIGRLPVMWSSYAQSSDKIHPVQLMQNLASCGLTISFLTEKDTENVFTQSYAAIAGTQALKDCCKLSKEQDILPLIHPSWRHGFTVHYEAQNLKQKEQEKLVVDSVCSHSSSSAKTALMVQTVDPQESSKQDVEDGPVFQSDHLQEQVLQISPTFSKTGQFQSCFGQDSIQDPLTDAVDLTAAWEEQEEEEDRTAAAAAVEQDLALSPMEVDFSLEEELLGLSRGFTGGGGGDLVKVDSSERKRKMKDSVQSNPWTENPALVQQNKGQMRPVSMELTKSNGYGNGNGIPTATVIQTQRLQGIGGGFLKPSMSDQYYSTRLLNGINKTCSPTTTTTGPISIENTGPVFQTETDFFNFRHAVEGSQGDLVNPFDESGPSTERQSSSSFVPSASAFHSLFMLTDPKPPQFQGNSKKLRTTTQQWSPPLPAMNLSTAVPVHQTRPLINKYVNPVILWKGPLYAAEGGIGSRISAPEKLFDMELRRAPGSFGRIMEFPNLTGQTEMIARHLCPSDPHKFSSFCTVHVDSSSMTNSGRSFLECLVRRNLSAVIDLISSDVRYLVLFSERSPIGDIKILAGF